MSFLRSNPDELTPRKAATDRQKASSARNYALFQLRSMKGHLHHIQGQVPAELFEQLQHAISDCAAHVEREIENGKTRKN